MPHKLDALDTEFHHHNVVDFTDGEDSLAKEQEIVDENDNIVAKLSVRIKQSINRYAYVV